MLRTALGSLALATASPSQNPKPWPLAFTCDFSIRNDKSWSASNQGTYHYDWGNGQRMLIDNTHCTGGSPERRDLKCKALHRDGNLYGYGDNDGTGKPWCCMWHEGFTATPPDWVVNGTLQAQAEQYHGRNLAKYRLEKGMGVPVHTYYTEPDTSYPAAFVTGFGITLYYENFTVVDKIDPNVFAFPPQSCNEACPWDSSARNASATKADLTRPRSEYRNASYTDIWHTLNRHLRQSPSLNLKPCDDFSFEELTHLRRELYGRLSPDLQSVHELEAIGREMPFATVKDLQAHDSAIASPSSGQAYVRHALCLEAVLWWQHHTDDDMKALPIALPLLPEEEHAVPPPDAPNAVHEMHQKYRVSVEKFSCHYDDGYKPTFV